MARSSTNGNFSLSAAARAAVSAAPDAKTGTLLENIQRSHPRQTINANSARTAIAQARKQLGADPLRSAPATPVDAGALLQAKRFAESCGGLDHARQLIDNLASIQL